MADHPMLYSPSMVFSMIEGRKTNTRRLFKGIEQLPNGSWHILGGMAGVAEADVPRHAPDYVRIQSGDRLYVRETVRAEEAEDGTDGVRYLADNAWHPIVNRQDAADRWMGLFSYRGGRGLTVPAVHAPRWTSRLTQHVKRVRVERLLDISAADAKAEGLACLTKDGGRTWKYGLPDRDGLPGTDNLGWPWVEWNADPVKAYLHLWDKLNARRGFGSHTNPWVIVYEFDVIAENVDRIAA